MHLQGDVLYRKTSENVDQVIVPASLQEQYLRLAHTGITGGHLVTRRTRNQVRRRAYWIGWSRDTKRYCRQCAECCRRGSPPRQGPLQPILSGEPWERVSLDVTHEKDTPTLQEPSAYEMIRSDNLRIDRPSSRSLLRQRHRVIAMEATPYHSQTIAELERRPRHAIRRPAQLRD